MKTKNVKCFNINKNYNSIKIILNTKESLCIKAFDNCINVIQNINNIFFVWITIITFKKS